jgi:hypothetical protein
VNWDNGSSLAVAFQADRCRSLVPEFTQTVRGQILSIRDSGLTNMLDLPVVQRLAYESDFFELVLFLEEHRDAYVHFILHGEV